MVRDLDAEELRTTDESARTAEDRLSSQPAPAARPTTQPRPDHRHHRPAHRHRAWTPIRVFSHIV